ncbi:hypothetical protein D3C87_1620110 [compost metagenome]
MLALDAILNQIIVFLACQHPIHEFDGSFGMLAVHRYGISVFEGERAQIFFLRVKPHNTDIVYSGLWIVLLESGQASAGSQTDEPVTAVELRVYLLLLHDQDIGIGNSLCV